MKHIYKFLTIFLVFWSMSGVFAGFDSGSGYPGGQSNPSGGLEPYKTPVTLIGQLYACRDQEIMVPVEVTDFSEVASFRLILKYDTTRLHLTGILNTSEFPDFHYYDYPGEYLRITGRSESSGVTLANNSTLFTLVFQYSGGNTNLFWFPWNDSCHYELFPDFSPLTQIPPEAFYYDGSITEIPSAPVSVMVTSDKTQICQNDTVTFTAFAVNGGANPQFQWMVNGMNVQGAVGPTLVYLPSDNDRISCSLLSDKMCATGNPAVSNEVTIHAAPLLPVSVSITSSSDTICSGNLLTFTALPVNGGDDPAFQWFVNDLPIPGNPSSTYSFAPEPGDQIRCKLTSGFECVSGNPAISPTLAPVILPITTASVTLTASADEVCTGDTVQYIASVVSGGLNPGFSWTLNGEEIPGATGPILTISHQHSDTIRCRVFSSDLCPSVNPVYSAPVVVRVNPLRPVSVSIRPSSNPVCAGSKMAVKATAINGGNSPVYSWRINGVPYGGNSSQILFFPSNNDIVTCTVLSNVACPSGNPATSEPLKVLVQAQVPLSVKVEASALKVCEGTPVTFTAYALNGGLNAVYQWNLNGRRVGVNSPIYSYIPENGDIIFCTVYSNEPCITGSPANSHSLMMQVEPKTQVSVAITPPDTMICQGTILHYQAHPVTGGNNPVYQWQVNGQPVPGATNQSYAYMPSNGDSVRCLITVQSACASNNPALSVASVVRVDPMLAVNVSVLPGANPVCQGTSVTLKAKGVNPGSNPQYEWRRNGQIEGGNTSQITIAPSDNDTIICTLTSSVNCPVSNPVVSEPLVFRVTPPAVVKVDVIAGATSVCEGTRVTYNTLLTNGGTNPVYQWRVNGQNAGGNQPVFSYFPGNNDSVSCRVISNQACAVGNPANSNTIRMTVNPVLTANVIISASDSAVCEGTAVTFSAIAINGGASPHYQWFLNGVSIPGATSSQYTTVPQNEGRFTCRLTSSAPCVSNSPVISLPSSVIVDPIVPVSVVISSDFTEVCSGTPVSMTAVVVNGGTAPLYVWKVNGLILKSSVEPGFSYTPANNDAVWCEVLSNARCSAPKPAISDTLTLTVYPLRPVSVSLSAPPVTICDGNAVTFNAIAVNGGSNPVYQWLLNGTVVQSGVDSAYTFNPLSGDQVQCLLTSSVNCPVGNPAASQVISLTVHPNLPVSVTISSSSMEICAGAPVNFTASPVNGGASPQFQWMLNGINIQGATNSVYTYIPLDQDTLTCRLYSGISCPQGNPAASNALNVNVLPILPVSVSVSAPTNSVCEGQTLNFSAELVNGGNSPTYLWKVNGISVAGATNATYVYGPADGDLVSCVAVSSEQCTSGNPATSLPVEVAVYPYLPTSVTIACPGTTVCSGTAVTFSATAVNAGENPVYQWIKNGAVIPDSSGTTITLVPSNNDVIRCKVTSGYPCATGSPATSNQIKMKVNPSFPVSISISTPQTNICDGTSATFTAVPVNGGVFPVYQWRVNDSLIGGIGTSTFTYQPANFDTVTCTLQSTLTCTTGNPATSNAIVMTINELVPVDVTISASAYAVMPGTSVSFTAVPTNGGVNPTYQWKVNNNNIGTNSPVMTYTPSNNDAVKCVLTSSLPVCLSNNPATSDPKYIVVYATGTPCTGIPTVTHQGKVYNTIQVGTQCWLRENINYGTMVNVTTSQTNNSVVEKYCQTNEQSNCEIYGGLYQWAEAVQYLNGVTNTTHWNPLPTTPVQGICPPGWHIPTNAEATTMITFLGGTNQAGGKMKSTGTIHWNSPNVGATNQYGFTAFAGGSCLNGNFINLLSYGSFWTTTKGVLAVDAYFFGAAYNFAIVQTGQAYKISGLSVRCLKN